MPIVNLLASSKASVPGRVAPLIPPATGAAAAVRDAEARACGSEEGDGGGGDGEEEALESEWRRKGSGLGASRYVDRRMA
jgi:hypothetical protein